jgi:hypothetical protein
MSIDILPYSIRRYLSRRRSSRIEAPCSRTLREKDRTNLRYIQGEWVGPKLNHYISEFAMGYDDLTKITDSGRVWDEELLRKEEGREIHQDKVMI